MRDVENALDSEPLMSSSEATKTFIKDVPSCSATFQVLAREDKLTNSDQSKELQIQGLRESS
jgi:hypothetical protein